MTYLISGGSCVQLVTQWNRIAYSQTGIALRTGQRRKRRSEWSAAEALVARANHEAADSVVFIGATGDAHRTLYKVTRRIR